MYRPRRLRWRRARKGAWYLSHRDDDVILLFFIRPVCIPIGRLQRVPVDIKKECLTKLFDMIIVKVVCSTRSLLFLKMVFPAINANNSLK